MMQLVTQCGTGAERDFQVSKHHAMARGYAANRLANATDAPWTAKTWVRQARGEYRISPILQRKREEAARETID